MNYIPRNNAWLLTKNKGIDMQDILKQIKDLVDERDTLKEKLKEDQHELAEIYEAIVGADGINRYTHDEIIDRIYDLYDVYTKYVDEEDLH